jgi:hypothetical protein
MSGFIQIYGKRFSVHQATVGAKIFDTAIADVCWGPVTGGISWHFDIDAEEQQFDDDGYYELWKPRIYCQNFLLPAPASHWSHLAGQRLECPRPDRKHDQNSPCYYVWEHGYMRESTFAFGERSGNQFDFWLQGLDDEGTVKEVKEQILVETAITFTGVTVGSPDLNGAKKLLAQHFNPAEFRPIMSAEIPFINFELIDLS